MSDRVLATVWNWREPRAARAGGSPRRRGLIQAAVLLAVAVVFRWGLGHALPALIAGGLAAVVLVTSQAIPAAFAAIEGFGRRLGVWVGAALTWLLLVPVWLLIFVPGGLALRLQGRDPLHRSLRPVHLTYWIPRRRRPAREDYARQFLVEDREARHLERPVDAAKREDAR
ncbi:MAG TPA: hypothetical protein P5571_00850 [Candidatus Krumholzibacteria bacterium]|nr:hypothetical protein [Candidatus Krumholzibacteria bacterium]